MRILKNEYKGTPVEAWVDSCEAYIRDYNSLSDMYPSDRAMYEYLTVPAPPEAIKRGEVGPVVEGEDDSHPVFKFLGVGFQIFTNATHFCIEGEYFTIPKAWRHTNYDLEQYKKLPADDPSKDDTPHLRRKDTAEWESCSREEAEEFRTANSRLYPRWTEWHIIATALGVEYEGLIYEYRRKVTQDDGFSSRLIKLQSELDDLRTELEAARAVNAEYKKALEGVGEEICTECGTTCDVAQELAKEALKESYPGQTMHKLYDQYPGQPLNSKEGE